MAATGAPGAPAAPDIAFDEINRCPIFYLSTHGSYKIQQYVDGTIPLEVRVPDNTIVIESGNVGESCYFMHFKEIIEPLLYDRATFLLYLHGTPPASDPIDLQYKRINALSSCHIYKPRAIIPNRILTAETGYRENNNGRHGTRASDYGTYMTFTRYDSGSTGPVRVLEPIHRRLIEQAEGRIDPRSRSGATIKEDAFETYETMFAHVNSITRAEFKIIIFPICGTIFPTKPKVGVKVNASSISKIYDLQHAADIAWTATIGRPLKEVRDHIRTMYSGPSTVTNGIRVVGRNHYRRSGPVPFREGGYRSYTSKRVNRSSRHLRRQKQQPQQKRRQTRRKL
jgi:hypothetical protein